jgi:hypothetical protein
MVTKGYKGTHQNCLFSTLKKTVTTTSHMWFCPLGVLPAEPRVSPRLDRWVQVLPPSRHPHASVNSAEGETWGQPHRGEGSSKQRNTARRRHRGLAVGHPWLVGDASAPHGGGARRGHHLSTACASHELGDLVGSPTRAHPRSVSSASTTPILVASSLAPYPFGC